jgi:hypothetical protein
MYKLRKDSTGSAVYLDNGIVSKSPFINMLYNLMDLKTNKYLSRKNVANLLENHGFRVKDISEHNGLTFFCSQKAVSVGN